MKERLRLYLLEAFETPYFLANRINDSRYFIFCVIVFMRGMYFLSVWFDCNLTITDLCVLLKFFQAANENTITERFTW